MERLASVLLHRPELAVPTSVNAEGGREVEEAMVSLAFKCVVPVNPASIPAEKIIDIRHRYAEERGMLQAEIARLAEAGVPEDLARDLVLLAPLSGGLDVVLLAQDSGGDAGKAGGLYFAIGRELGLDRLRGLVGRFHPPEHWDRLALRRLMDDLSGAQRGIARKLLKEGMSVEQWTGGNAEALARTRDFLAAMEASGDLSVAKLMLASSQIQNLV
jgi:glutamate dehydrogenase